MQKFVFLQNNNCKSFCKSLKSLHIIFAKVGDGMFYRKIEKKIREYFHSAQDRILLVDGARQVGKSFIIRYTGKQEYKNYVEINLLEDKAGQGLFSNIRSIEEFYLQLSIAAGGNLGDRTDTLIFLDEIQAYPNLLALLKFLREDGKYTYIASGSMLGITLKKTISIPMGSIEQIHMYPMDFEEFLLAYGIREDVIAKVRESFQSRVSLPEGVHQKLLLLFKYYLLAGGMPDAVKAFTEEKNIPKMRRIQQDIHDFYAADASQYDAENRLKIRSIYDAVPSFMENRKKRIVVKNIEDRKGATFQNYKEEFDYLTASGIALDVKAVPTPVFPLTQGAQKNLLKLYLNDPGILTALLYGNNINAVLNDQVSVNLGSVYETAVACELKAHGYDLYYYDNRKKGEVDFLIDDYSLLSVLPIEVKSGKDYSTHAALDRFTGNADYSVKQAYVFSNSGEIKNDGRICYFPVYMSMFLKKDGEAVIPPIPDVVFP